MNALKLAVATLCSAAIMGCGQQTTSPPDFKSFGDHGASTLARKDDKRYDHLLQGTQVGEFELVDHKNSATGEVFTFRVLSTARQDLPVGHFIKLHSRSAFGLKGTHSDAALYECMHCFDGRSYPSLSRSYIKLVRDSQK